MEMKLMFNQNMELKTDLSTVIQTGNLLKIPDEVLNAIVNAVYFNPESTETTLQNRKIEKSQLKDSSLEDNSYKVQCLYASLIPSKGDSEGINQSGMIISPDLRILENSLGGYKVNVIPDVTYIGRTNGKPELVFSDHLKGSLDLRILQLDASKYPETAKLMSQLRNFDEWKRKTLQNAYVIIGGTQREFFEEFDKKRFNILSTKDLAEELGYNQSTIHRILSNRWVEARNKDGDQKVLYASDLLVTKTKLKKYMILPKLNQIFLEEYQRGKAYSDLEIGRRIPEISRRAINKYRLKAGIPKTTERTKHYQSSERFEPYIILE